MEVAAKIITLDLNEQGIHFATEMSEVTLDDSNATWLQGMTVGEYHHPKYGKIDLSHENLVKYAENLKKNVRGIDLDIDYEHKRIDGRAAGWVKDAEVRSDGLWLFVEFTDEGARKVKNKEYRYFSPTFATSWENPKTKETHSNVLFGGALTNRPFLKDIQPINFDELDLEEKMDRKKLIKLLALSDDASDEDIVTAIKEKNKVDLSKAKVDLNEDEYKATVTLDDSEVVVEFPKPKIEKKDTTAKKLEEFDPELAKQFEEQQKAIKRLEAVNHLSTVNQKLDSIKFDEGELAPNSRNKVAEVAAKLPRELADQLIEAVGSIEFVETGQRKTGKSNVKDDASSTFESIDKKIRELQEKDDNLTYNDALMKLSEEDEALLSQYTQALAFAEVVDEGDED